MSSPVLFDDLGKEYKDLNTKEFTEKVKVENTSVDDHTTFNVSVTKDDNHTTGQFQHKLKVPDHGVNTLTQYDTKNAFKFELSHADRLAKGLKAIGTFEMDFGKGKKSSKFAVEYKSNHFAFNASLNQDPIGSKTSALGAFVFGQSHPFGYFNAGLSASYTFGSKKPSAIAVALTNKLNAHLVSVHVRQTNEEQPGLKFTTSYFYKPKDNKNNLEVGAEVEKDIKNNDVSITAVSAFDLDGSSRVKAKVNTAGELQLALIHTISSNFKLSVASRFNLQTGHVKPGFTLTFNN